MNATEKEINKFIGLFWREDYERVCDFLSSKTLLGIYTLMSETDCHNSITVVEEEFAVDPSNHYNISNQVTSGHSRYYVYRFRWQGYQLLNRRFVFSR